MTESKLTQCCQARVYLDVLPCDGVEFARVPRCLACNSFKGSVKINYSAPKALAAGWTGSSEAAMVEVFAKRMGPMKFTLQGKTVLPEGWKPAQPELVEEDNVPF